MSEVGMQIEVGADVTGLTTGLNKVDAQVTKFGATLKKLSDTAVTADGSLKKISGGSNQAGFALQNLGRIAQDAPFGFIGIQNNINPLLESFQRLKAESGSTGGAFKALAASLGGAGGLGLAVSVATSVFTLFAMGMFDSKESAKDLGAEIESLGIDFEQAKKQVEDFNKEIDATKGLRDINLKLNLPGEKNRINVEFGFDKLDLETKLRELRDLEASSEEKRVNTFDLMSRKGSKSLSDLVGQYGSLNEVKKNSFDLSDQDIKLLDAAIKAEDEKIGIIRQQEILRISINKLSAKNKEDIVELNKKEAERIENLNTIDKVLLKLSEKIKVLNKEQDLFGIDKSKEKVSAITSTIETLFSEFKLNPKNTIIQKLFGDIQELKPLMDRLFANIKIPTSAQILIDQQQAQKEADSKIGTNPIIIKGKIDIQNSDKESDFLKNARSFAKMMEDGNIAASQNVLATWQDAFAGVGEGIGEALGGGGNLIQAAFSNLFKIIGGGLKQLGIAMIGLGTAKEAVEKFHFAPGVGTVIAGIATVALGALLQSALPKFAVGTQNFAGGMAIVGERGPELAYLPKGSGVIPNDKLSNISGGSSIRVYGEFVQRGQHLVAVINQTNNSNKRAF